MALQRVCRSEELLDGRQAVPFDVVYDHQPVRVFGVENLAVADFPVVAEEAVASVDLVVEVLAVAEAVEVGKFITFNT